MTVNKLDNLKVLTEKNSVAKVLAAGFWESDVITELLDAEAQKLIIFEPEKGLYEAAKAKYADAVNVDVRNSTLAEKTGEADYFVFKPNRFSSLLKPKQLVKIYRKNHNDNITKINVSTIQIICEEEKLSQSAGNILLLGANCSSSILRDAEQMKCLSLFDVIIVRQPKKGLYETEDTGTTFSDLLQQHKFNVVQELSQDPMYTQFVFVRDYQSEKINTLQTKVTEAESRSAELEKKLGDAISRSSQFEASVAESTKLNSELDSKLAHTNIQTEQLSAENTMLQTDKKQLVAKVADLQAKHNELTDSQKNKDAKIAELTQHRDQQAKGHQEIKQRAETLKDEKEHLLAKVASLQSKHNELTESKKNNEVQIAELTQQRDQQAKGHQEIKQRAEALKKQNEQLVAEVAALQSKYNELAESQKRKDAQIAEFSQQRDQHAKGLQETRQRAEALKKQNEQLLAEVAALQSKYNELEESQKNNDAQIAELSQQRDQQAKGHQETKQRAEALKKQNEQLVAEVAALQAKYSELADSQLNKDSQIGELTQQCDQQAKGHQETKQRAEALKAQNEKLTAQVTESQANHAEQVESQKHVDAKIAELIQQRDQQAKGHQEIQQRTEALNAKYETLCDEIILLKDRNVKLSNHNQQLMQQTDELTNESQRQIAELIQQRDQQTEEHQETKQQVLALKEENDTFGAENIQQQTEKQQLLAQIEILQATYKEQAENQLNNDEKITKLTQQIDQQTKKFQETKQQFEELKALNERLSVEHTQQQTEKEQLSAQVASLQAKSKEVAESQLNSEAQIVELTQQRDQQTKEHHAKKLLAEKLSKQCEELRVYCAERQKSADLALRLQTKAQMDLDNSRAQYQLKHMNEQKLVDLVSELRVKLQQAAEYYFELQEKHPELNASTQEQFERSHIDEIETLSVDRPKKKPKSASRPKQRKSTRTANSGKI